ncbi:hypothetical protein [Streptomyces catenulae]|uniref:Uncharacterized protein n=1 Tax=Streptomyces catenulae TaxID=66875 RepID=A0ABV2YS35_9ACTN|nr:hypothetical protein [Streptomyces catenulae]
MTSAAPATEDLFAHARQIADAVLLEGYVLYPYRASAAKNRMRWQFGVLVPPRWPGAAAEHTLQRTECLLEPRGNPALHAQVRFLHARRRTVQRALPDGTYETVEALELPDRVVRPWDEGVTEQVDLTTGIADLTGDGVRLPFALPAHEESEPLYDGGCLVGRQLRRREHVAGELHLRATELDGPCRLLRLTATVRNTGDWDGDGTADRAAALPYSLLSAHLLLGTTSGAFLSLTDPPEWASGAAADCRNAHTWPVLAGADGTARTVLSSPIILEDHPRIAPESPGVLYDATEIDEILALRTAALTDQEKREARGTDDRAAAVIDLADSMPPEVLERLHGAVRALREVTGDGPPPPPDRAAAAPPDPFDGDTGGAPWWDPAADAAVDPVRDRVLVDGTPVGAGSRVALRPGPRRTDAQDLFLHGRTAVVEAVLHDVDGGVHLAVTVDGDPGADIRREQGRFLYFQPDELTPLAAVEDG